LEKERSKVGKRKAANFANHEAEAHGMRSGTGGQVSWASKNKAVRVERRTAGKWSHPISRGKGKCAGGAKEGRPVKPVATERCAGPKGDRPKLVSDQAKKPTGCGQNRKRSWAAGTRYLTKKTNL